MSILMAKRYGDCASGTLSRSLKQMLVFQLLSSDLCRAFEALGLILLEGLGQSL